MNQPKLILAILLGSMIFSATVQSESLPDYYPPAFNKWGIIDRVDISRGDIVVNDTLMHISENVKVHTTSTRFASVHALENGLQIGVIFAASSPVKRMIDEIWILPADYSPGSD